VIVKLRTTTSTNTYLKEWLSANEPENFMVIVADKQTDARGQMGTKWLSEQGKNLTFSIFVKLDSFDVSRQFEINQVVSLAILLALKKYVPNLKIKWPNDILADNKKIAGILIENTVSKNWIKHSIIGIGLNVNQTEFPTDIPNASSLKLLLNKSFNLDSLLQEIVTSIEQQFYLLETRKSIILEKEYLENMFLFQEMTQFKIQNGNSFVGKIVGITPEGRLQIKLQNTEILDFGYKEIAFL